MGFQLVCVAAIKQQLPQEPEIKARSESCGFMLYVTSASKRPRFVPSPGTRKNTVCLWTESGERPVRQSVRPMWILAFGWVWNQKEKKGRKRMEVEAAPQKKAKHGFGEGEKNKRGANATQREHHKTPKPHVTSGCSKPNMMLTGRRHVWSDRIDNIRNSKRPRSDFHRALQIW